ncbi:MAG: hypothetical protein ACI30N_07120 [Muribaculaceae bacterium]
MKKTFRILTILSLMTLTTMAAACSSAVKNTETPREDAVVIAPRPTPVTGMRGNGASYLPKAIIYKTNGDYNNLVPVNLNPDGTLLSYPDPTDVGEFSTPLPLADGWLLDRRGGIGTGTRFTRWTYPQYHALPQVPSPQELLQNLVPEARVTEAYRLPINAHPADTAACNALIRNGLPNCTKLL